MLTVVYDACVLYSAPLRDLLMQLALEDIFCARWSDRIQEEWIRNLLANRSDLSREQLERTRQQMETHVIDCLITDYESIIETLELPDQNDRHVLAAAIRSHSSFIVTFNLADFPHAILKQHGVEAILPDDFIARLIAFAPKKVLEAAHKRRRALRTPPKSVDEHLETLAMQRLPKTVKFLREHREEI
jgi:predicted nucleic acid-binding protein